MLFLNQLGILGFVPFYFLFFVIIGYTGVKLAGRHFSDIRIIWYLFSLALTITLLIASWASSAGAVDKAGGFQGDTGAMLLKLFKGTLDLDAAIAVYGGAVAVVLLPQFASWVLSGLFGCASAPIWVGPAFRFFIWSIVKSMIVASGVIVATGGYGWATGWEKMHAKQVADHTLVALLLLTGAFVMLFVYRDLEKELLELIYSRSSRAAKLRNLFVRINIWMNRRIAEVDAPVPNSPIYSMSASFTAPPAGRFGQWTISAEYEWSSKDQGFRT